MMMEAKVVMEEGSMLPKRHHSTPYYGFRNRRLSLNWWLTLDWCSLLYIDEE